MQRYALFFIIVNALHVSGGSSAHHQELRNCTHSIGYMSSLLADFQLTHASGSSKQRNTQDSGGIPTGVKTVNDERT